MKKHTKIYLDHFGYGPGDWIACEVCGKKAVDIHHIEPRGMGGDPQGKKDVISNLQALCRECHHKADFTTELPKEKLKEIHNERLRLWA